LKLKLVILVKNTRNLDYHTNMMKDMKEFLPYWSEKKFDYCLSLDLHAELTFHTGPISLVNLKVLKDILWPDYDYVIVMGSKKIGDYMGMFAKGEGIIYGYYNYHYFWRFLNRAITFSISHELSHYILDQKGKPPSIWVDRVHTNDSVGLKDRMKWNDDYYITLGGEY